MLSVATYFLIVYPLGLVHVDDVGGYPSQTRPNAEVSLVLEIPIPTVETHTWSGTVPKMMGALHLLYGQTLPQIGFVAGADEEHA